MEIRKRISRTRHTTQRHRLRSGLVDIFAWKSVKNYFYSRGYIKCRHQVVPVIFEASVFIKLSTFKATALEKG